MKAYIIGFDYRHNIRLTAMFFPSRIVERYGDYFLRKASATILSSRLKTRGTL
jgi:hypothetical protein